MDAIQKLCKLNLDRAIFIYTLIHPHWFTHFHMHKYLYTFPSSYIIADIYLKSINPRMYIATYLLNIGQVILKIYNQMKPVAYMYINIYTYIW